MSDELVERVIGGLRVRIDRTLCVGFGDCVTAAPDAFILDSEDIAVFRAPDLGETGADHDGELG